MHLKALWVPAVSAGPEVTAKPGTAQGRAVPQKGAALQATRQVQGPLRALHESRSCLQPRAGCLQPVLSGEVPTRSFLHTPQRALLRGSLGHPPGPGERGAWGARGRHRTGRCPHVQAAPAGCLPESPGMARDGWLVSNTDVLNRPIKALENYTGTQFHRRLIGVCQEAFWHASTLLAQERSVAEPRRASPQQPGRCC